MPIRSSKWRVIEAFHDIFQRVIPFATFAFFSLSTNVAYAQTAPLGINQTGPNPQGNVTNIITNNYYYDRPRNAEKKTSPQSEALIPLPEQEVKPEALITLPLPEQEVKPEALITLEPVFKVTRPKRTRHSP